MIPVNLHNKASKTKEYKREFADQVATVVAHIDMLNRDDPERVEAEDVYMHGYYWTYHVTNYKSWGLKEGRIHRNLYTKGYCELNGNACTSSWFYDRDKNRARTGGLKKTSILTEKLHVDTVKTEVRLWGKCPICSYLGTYKTYKNLATHMQSKKHKEQQARYINMLFANINTKAKLNMDVMETIVSFL